MCVCVCVCACACVCVCVTVGGGACYDLLRGMVKVVGGVLPLHELQSPPLLPQPVLHRLAGTCQSLPGTAPAEW